MRLLYGLAVAASVGLIILFWLLPLDIISIQTESLVRPSVERKLVPQVKVMPDPNRPQVNKDSTKGEKTREDGVLREIHPLEHLSAPVTPRLGAKTQSFTSVKSEIRDWLDTLGKASPLLTLGVAVWSRKKRGTKKRGTKKDKKDKRRRNDYTNGKG